MLLAGVLEQVDDAVCQDKHMFVQRLPLHVERLILRYHTRPHRWSSGLAMLLTMNARWYQS